jgi:hypothetical protein
MALVDGILHYLTHGHVIARRRPVSHLAVDFAMMNLVVSGKKVRVVRSRS